VAHTKTTPTVSPGRGWVSIRFASIQ